MQQYRRVSWARVHRGSELWVGAGGSWHSPAHAESRQAEKGGRGLRTALAGVGAFAASAPAKILHFYEFDPIRILRSGGNYKPNMQAAPK